jgi:hypothetical protein
MCQSTGVDTEPDSSTSAGGRRRSLPELDQSPLAQQRAARLRLARLFRKESPLTALALRSTAKQLLAKGEERPRTQSWEDRVTAALATLTLFAVFWDGYKHNNTGNLDTFWNPAHIAMYAGLIALGGWIGLVFLRYQPKDRLQISMSAVPHGYGLALVALPLAALGGPGDFAWHEAYGFENQVDAPFSPTHQMLFLSGALLGAIPLASSWVRAGRKPNLGALWPAVLSLTSVVAMVNFTFMNLLPYFWAMVPTSAFQDDVERYPDAYEAGADIIHPEGLAQAAAHYGDEPFPYYLFANMQVIGGILIFTAVLVAAVLYLRRRWVLPFGSITLMCALLSVLFPFFTGWREPHLIAALIATGLLIDVLLRLLVAGDPPSRVRLRLCGALMPLAIWVPYELSIAIADGLGWGPTVYLGMLSTTAGVGYAISLVMFPPPLPAIPEPEAA